MRATSPTSGHSCATRPSPPPPERSVNVAELVELLGASPDDAPIGVLSIGQAGIVIDVETANAVTVEQTIADDGTVQIVWITGIGQAPAPPPSLITWPCTCGEVITVDPHASWPYEHDEHLDGTDLTT
jgi:hypothetical protein